MKVTMKKHIFLALVAMISLASRAQLTLDNSGDIFLGTTSTSKVDNQRITVKSYNGLRWKTTGNRYFSVKPTANAAIFDGTGSKVYLYDRQANGYMAIHVGDMQIVMQPMANGQPIASGTEQVLNLNASLRGGTQPAAVTTDASGNEMASVGQTIALMVAALQSLEAQADAQQAEIEALRGQAKSKKAGKGQLQDVEGIHSSQVISNNSDTPKYDLQGRRVENPKQGEIYIQKGKKTRK